MHYCELISYGPREEIIVNVRAVGEGIKRFLPEGHNWLILSNAWQQNVIIIIITLFLMHFRTTLPHEDKIIDIKTAAYPQPVRHDINNNDFISSFHFFQFSSSWIFCW